MLDPDRDQETDTDIRHFLYKQLTKEHILAKHKNAGSSSQTLPRAESVWFTLSEPNFKIFST